MTHLSDVAIVGAGPAGITAALYLARSGSSVLLFEQLTPGGQVLQTESIENYPGFPNGVKGYELADLFSEHLNEYDIKKPRGEVSSIFGKAGDFTVRTQADTEEHHVKAIIAASGVYHKHLGVHREDELLGKGVSYCAICDGNFYRNLPVAVVGGGNSALEEALYLANIASEVHIIHRRDTFRGEKIFLKKLENMPEKVKFHLDSIITDLEGDKQLTGLKLRNVKNGITDNIAVEGLFVYVGFNPMSQYLPTDVEKDVQGFIITDTEMRTNVPGIFAAGDIRSKLCRQVITAAGDGATAAHATFIFLEELHAG